MTAVLSPSARLSAKLDLIALGFATPGRLLIEHPRARELYPPYAIVGTHIAMAMVPLMEVALERSRALAGHDAVAAGLVRYLEHHIPEEMHGEEPAGEHLEDLAVLGYDPDALRREPPSGRIAAVIGRMFFRIRHAHPAAVLGFLWLETFPPGRQSVDELIAATGLPREAFRQLLVHSVVDVRHSRELREALDALPVEPWQEELISVSALDTMSTLVDAWLEIVRRAD